MKPILETLDPATRETLITWCQTERNYAAISQRAAKPLHPAPREPLTPGCKTDRNYAAIPQRAANPLAEGGLTPRISPPPPPRLYATHNIADSKEARAQYAASLGLECKKLRLLQGTR